MAFDRTLKLTVESEGNKLTDISKLHIQFNIDRNRKFEENSAEIVVINAAESTRKEILKKGNAVVLNAGYSDEGNAVIFSGNITKSDSKQQGPDWMTTIQSQFSQSIKKKKSNFPVTLSFARDTLLSTVLNQISVTMGLTLVGSENANINLDNGYVFVGSARGALNYCQGILKANNARLYRDNTSIIIYNIDSRPTRFEPVFLGYASGLLNAEDITDDDTQEKKQKRRIGFDSILIPKLQPNGVVTIASSNINGTFIIDSLNFSGDNFGGSFNCSGECEE